MSAPAPDRETATRTVKPGWNGGFFQDFAAGDVSKHVLGRAITATDSAWFTLLPQNTAPLHFDTNYAAHTSFGKPLVNSVFTIALTGQTVSHVSQNGIRGRHAVQLDESAQSSRVEIASRGRRKTTGYNPNGDIVIAVKRTLLVYRRGHRPSGRHRPEPWMPTPP